MVACHHIGKTDAIVAKLLIRGDVKAFSLRKSMTILVLERSNRNQKRIGEFTQTNLYQTISASMNEINVALRQQWISLFVLSRTNSCFHSSTHFCVHCKSLCQKCIDYQRHIEFSSVNIETVRCLDHDAYGKNENTLGRLGRKPIAVVEIHGFSSLGSLVPSMLAIGTGNIVQSLDLVVRWKDIRRDLDLHSFAEQFPFFECGHLAVLLCDWDDSIQNI